MKITPPSLSPHHSSPHNKLHLVALHGEWHNFLEHNVDETNHLWYLHSHIYRYYCKLLSSYSFQWLLSWLLHESFVVLKHE